MAAGGIVLVIGLFVLVAAARLRRAMRRFARVAERTTGEVISLRTALSRAGGGAGGVGDGPRPSRSYFPTVSFTTQGGETVTAESKVGTNPPAGRVGETVGVLYDPADPHDIRINTRRGQARFVPTLFTALGGVLVAVGILVLVVAH